MQRLLLLAASTCSLWAPASALHPRPHWKDIASFARWLVHESEYGVVSTFHKGSNGILGNVMSISDGEGYEHSTGLIYGFIPDLDVTYIDLMQNSEVSITFSEMALANGTSGGCAGSTAEDAPCGRFIINGRLTLVPEGEESKTALKYLFARHPMMEGWSGAHVFKPFWMAKENITSTLAIDMYGGAAPFTLEEYFAAPWYRKAPEAAGWTCSVCGHTYDAAKDGNGKAFEELPDDWTCPVCGHPKSSYHRRTLADGSFAWVHV